MNKKGQINILTIVFIILIIAVIVGVFVDIRLINENKRLNALVEKGNIEYHILRDIIQDYYTLPPSNIRNSVVNLKIPCQIGTRAFSENGLIEYQVACISNSTSVLVPILYNNHSTKLYVWNGKLIPVELGALNKTK